MRERATLMRIAPHLVHPLPVLIPTYGHWMKGKEVLTSALIINDLMSFDRNRLGDPQKHIPRSRVISKKEVLQLLPGIHEQGLTGGVIFHDAQVYNSERLLLSFLRSSEKAGANVANYVEVTGFLKDGDCVAGVKAKDVLTGDRFDIRARTVVNASGPWVDHVVGSLNGQRPHHTTLFAKAINVLTRPLFETYAVGIAGQVEYQDAYAVIDKGNRLLFITPWRDHSLIGTAYTVYKGKPDDFAVTQKDIQDFLNQINTAYLPARFTMEDVSFVHSGLLPSSGICPRTGEVQLSQQYKIHDHRDEGIQGLISVIGIKYTTARDVAEKVVNHAFDFWGQKPPKSLSSATPLYGGKIDRFDLFVRDEVNKRQCGLKEGTISRLVYNYGSAYQDVLRHLDNHANQDRAHADDVDILKAEVLHAIYEEMAQKLTDVVFRRTELGTVGHPGDEYLQTCAGVMQSELGWTSARMQRELQDVNEMFSSGKTQSWI